MRQKTDFTNINCCICNKGDLTSGTAYRQYEKGVWTKRWICKHCYETYRRFKSYTRPEKQYNVTNTCDNIKEDGKRCENILPLNEPRKLYEDGKWNGKWVCKRCYMKIYDKKRDRKKEYRERYISYRRAGNLNIDSSSGKGDILQAVTCLWKGVKDLNIYYDNYRFPLDHSRDPTTGFLYQTESAGYNSQSQYWHQNWEREHNKEFNYLIFYCMSRDYKIIERIYIFPKAEVMQTTSIGIYKYANGWYVKYRMINEEELKMTNDILKRLINIR